MQFLNSLLSDIVSNDLLEAFIQLLLAAIVGMVIGAERERSHKSAGLRTHTLVSIGSALFTILSVQGFNPDPNTSFDPSRIAGQIVIGIGFLGAGLIFYKGNKVQGLTSAAGIWVTAALGMAVGLGFYALALFTTLLVLIVFAVLTKLEAKIAKDD